MIPVTRIPVRRSPAILPALTAAVLLGTPAAVGAQQAPAAAAGAWRIEPTVGLWHQGGNPGLRAPRSVGPLAGLTVSRQDGERTRWTANVRYHRLDDAYELEAYHPTTGEPRTYTYDRDLLSVTAGGSIDTWQGGVTSISLGGELGAGWSRHRLDRSAGATIPPVSEMPARGEWAPLFVGVSSLAVRRAIASHLEVTTAVRLLGAVGDMEPAIVAALTMGTAYRF
jgi:hypothetical protein